VHEIGEVGNQIYLSMAYTLGNKYAKNLCKRIVLLQLIIENVVTFFLEHSVVGYYPTYSVLYAVVLYGVTAVSHVNAGVSASFQISSLTVGGMFYTLALICLLSWVTWLSVEPGRPLHGPAVARRMNVTRRR